MALLLLMVAVALAGCAASPSEQALREQVAAMQAAVEARDNGALMDPVAEDFVGNGGMDRDGLRRYAVAMLLRQSNIGVQTGPLDVNVQGETARVAFTVGVTGGEGFLPDNAQVYAVDTGWRHVDGEWMLISASWEPKL